MPPARVQDGTLTAPVVVMPHGCCRQVQRVKGLDLSPNEIDEARRRYDELVNKNRGKPPPRLHHWLTQLRLRSVEVG